MSSQPLWLHNHESKYPPLQAPNEYDVVIIGGGITGIVSAYFLKKGGYKVCVLEKGTIAGGVSGHTSAHLTYVTDTRFRDLIDVFGDEGAELAWKGGLVAIDLIEWVVKQLDIDCDFKRVPGFLIGDFLKKETDERLLERDADFASDRGFNTTLIQSTPFFECPGMVAPNQARFHPVKFLDAIAKTIPGEGCAIFENSEVAEVKNDPTVVVANGVELPCNHVIIATNLPIRGKVSKESTDAFRMRLASYSSYVISAQVEKDRLPEALFWDTRRPYHYLRVDSGKTADRVILGGADHKTGQSNDTTAAYRELETLLQHLVPGARTDHRWSGQVIETNDGLPYIGEFGEKQYIATGFAGNGMTFGVLAASMAYGYVSGRPGAWDELFSTKRHRVMGGTWRYLTENLDFPYYFIRDSLFPVDRESPESLLPNEGKVLRIGSETVACARDNEGILHECSAVCTHMGCHVHWNSAEQTWDCPCHGSRFSIDGRVISGPADTPLASVVHETIHTKDV